MPLSTNNTIWKKKPARQFKKFSLNPPTIVTMFESINVLSLFTEKQRAVKVKQKSMISMIMLDDIDAEVTKKKIKHLHLKVCPPNGIVRVSAPLRMNQEKIRVFALSKLDWIRKQRLKIRSQVREKPLKYINQETHYFKGHSYQLKVLENNKPPFAELVKNEILIHVPTGADMEKRRSVLNEWYHKQLMELLNPLIKKWELKLGVSVKRFSIRSMKSRWGSCTPKTHGIRFNLELVKKSHECLEYIVVHELVHLLEASHNNRFKALMDQFYPNWKLCRKELNGLQLKS